MPSVILQEIDIRIKRLKNTEENVHTTEVEKQCIQSRRLELESMKNFISERIGNRENKSLTNHDFWRLIDEF